MQQNSARKSATSDQQFQINHKAENQMSQKQAHFYNIVIGNYKYIPTPWTEEDLQPDLVLTMKLPKDQYIQKRKFLSLSSYLSTPLAQLQNAFSKAQQQILAEMTKNKEQSSADTIKVRLQKAIEKKPKKTKTLAFLNQQDQKQSFQIECVHQKNKILDAYTLQYNAIVYTLQRVCGFRVRSFLLYDQDIENQRIFLFLNLSPQNRIKVAIKYKMKKEIDYSQIDFFLNDPCGNDGRPLKLHSSYKKQPAVVKNHKQTNRYFNIRDHFLQTNGVIDQQDFTFQQQNRFLLFNEETQAALRYFKKNKDPILSNYQKKYIFLYNNKKINKGCKIMYQKFTQRRQFFSIVKCLSDKYQFRSTQEPEIFQKFILPGKDNKGAGFFQRLRGILLYKPQAIGPQGQIDLFLKMQKIKLAYLVLKKTFKMNFLQKIGFDIFAFGSQFQLTGKGGDKNNKGGVDGQNVTDKWPVYVLFTNLSTIRNYYGDIVGHQISFKIYMFYYFIASAIPYTMLYILQQSFKSYIYLGSDFVKLILIGVMFRVYITLWNLFQDEFIDEYRQQVTSKIFLNTYRGPYMRNMITDQVNQYEPESGIQGAAKNLVCLLIIAALLVASGAIFHGCRMLLLNIYDTYANYKVSSISLPHLFAYFMFFVSMDLLRFMATDHIIDLLVLIRNPPSDEDSREYGHTFRFYYLLGIQMIAPIFFLIIEPLQNTSCYAKNCNKQIEYYVYSRYIIKLASVFFHFIKIFIIKYSTDLKNILIKQKQYKDLSFQARLSNLIMDSVKQSQRKQHNPNNSFELIIIIGYALYSLLLPVVVIISLFSIFIQIFNVRASLLAQERRPINKSQSILRLSSQMNIIFVIAVITNSWMMIFSFETIESAFPRLIQVFLGEVSKDLVFFLKLIITGIMTLFLLFLASIAGELTKLGAENWLIKRKKNKFHNFIMSEYTDKLSLKPLQERIPVKSIFRTWNPTEMPHQQLQRALNQYGEVFNGVFQEEEDAQTYSQFSRRH